MAARDVVKRVRTICLGLPGATEKLSHGAPAFFAQKQFLHLWPDGHHEDQYPHLWCAAPPGAQEAFVGAQPQRFFRPPYVGSRGWLGLRLDGHIWVEVENLCEEAFRTVAPRRLVAELENTRSGR